MLNLEEADKILLDYKNGAGVSNDTLFTLADLLLHNCFLLRAAIKQHKLEVESVSVIEEPAYADAKLWRILDNA